MKPQTQAEIDQWNEGARQADSSWWQHAEGPFTQYAERAPDGRSIHLDYQGHYTRKGNV